MIFSNVFIILALALIVSLISYYVFGVRGPWENFWIKALFLFLFLLAMSLWIKPIGPQWYGVQWTVLLISAVLFVVLLANFPSSDESPRIPSNLSLLEKRRLAKEYTRERKMFIYSLGMMFWLLLILLITIIIAGYYMT